MKKRVTNILGLVFVFAMFLPFACKEKQEPDPFAVEKIPVKDGSAQLELTIDNPAALFDCPSGSNLTKDNPCLQYISLSSPGNLQWSAKGFKESSDNMASIKHLVSVLATNQAAQWRIKSAEPGKYPANIVQIDLTEGREINKNPQEDVSYDDLISQLQTELNKGNDSIINIITNAVPCQIFEKLLYSSNGRIYDALDGLPNESATPCIQEYFIWFTLQYRDNRNPGDPTLHTRTFRLDPWVIRNP